MVCLCWESWLTLSKTSQPWIASCRWCFFVFFFFPNGFLGMGWLDPSINAYVVFLGISTPFSLEDRLFHSCQHMSFVCVPTFLQWKLLLNFWYLGINYLMFYLSLTFFPSQTEDILVKLPLEDYSKGQVGCKTYKNYFTAGTHWSIIIFLILVNIAAQVNKDIYFGLCP